MYLCVCEFLSVMVIKKFAFTTASYSTHVKPAKMRMRTGSPPHQKGSFFSSPPIEKDMFISGSYMLFPTIP